MIPINDMMSNIDDSAGFLANSDFSGNMAALGESLGATGYEGHFAVEPTSEDSSGTGAGNNGAGHIVLPRINV